MIAVLSLIDLSALGIVGGVALVAILRRSSLGLKLGRVEATVGQVEATVAAVNAAVNNRPEGDPTLYEQVRAQGLALDNATQATHATARKVDQMAVLFTTHIAQHEADAGRAPR